MAYTMRGPRVDLDASALRNARLTRRWTQFDLAIAARLQPSTISRIETGAQSPTLVTAERLAAALAVRVDQLIGVKPHFRPSRAWSCHRRIR